MRLPLVAQVSSKDGESNKNSRMTNVLTENSSTGRSFAALRPNLVSISSQSGNGNGLTEYDSELISVFGATLAVGPTCVTLATVEDAYFDFVESV